MSSQSSPKARPLSPHLQIYKPQLTMILSITHRASGIFLSLGTPLLVYWLWTVASGQASYIEAQECFSSIWVQILLLGWTAAFFYHLCNGIRHLFWDIGRGFEIKNLYTSGYVVIAAASVLTLITWLIAKGVI